MARAMQDRAVQTRKVLLLAAAEVFDECGYAGAGINRILERAGLTAGALYFHFGSKQGLAQAVMNAQPEAIEVPRESRGLQRLVDLTMIWSYALQTSPLLRAGVRLTGEQASFGMSDATPYATWTQIMRECLFEARGARELRAGVEPEQVADFVVSACTGMQEHAQVVSGRADLPQRTVEMWRLLLPGVATPEAARRIDLSLDNAKASATPATRKKQVQ